MVHYNVGLFAFLARKKLHEKFPYSELFWSTCFCIQSERGKIFIKIHFLRSKEFKYFKLFAWNELVQKYFT